jgi:hypothetical protein
LLEERARGAGLRLAEWGLAEWVREVLLAAPVEPGMGSGVDSGEFALAEVLVLRSLLLNLHSQAAKDEPVAETQMRGLTEGADGAKMPAGGRAEAGDKRSLLVSNAACPGMRPGLSDQHSKGGIRPVSLSSERRSKPSAAGTLRKGRLNGPRRNPLPFHFSGDLRSREGRMSTPEDLQPVFRTTSASAHVIREAFLVR